MELAITLARVNVSLSFSERIECLPQLYPKLRLFEFRILSVFSKRKYGEKAFQSWKKICYIFFNNSYTASKVLDELLRNFVRTFVITYVADPNKIKCLQNATLAFWVKNPFLEINLKIFKLIKINI